MDQAHGLGAHRLDVGAGGHHLQGVLRVDQPRNALGAARAGENADLDFRQGQIDRVIIGDDAAMAGQRKLQCATHAGAIDRGDPRFARGLELAEHRTHLAGHVEQDLDSLVRIGSFFSCIGVEQTFDHREIGSAGERPLLSRRKDGTLDVGA